MHNLALALRVPSAAELMKSQCKVSSYNRYPQSYPLCLCRGETYLEMLINSISKKRVVSGPIGPPGIPRRPYARG